VTRTELILNPAGGRGKAAALLPRIANAFAAIGVRTVLETTARGDEERLAREAIARGVTTLVAVGGDGTCSGIANAILKSGSPCRLAVVPAGTGNDFAKTLGVSGWQPEQVAALIARAQPIAIDAGLIDGHHFVNSCGFGFDASVLAATERVKFLKGDALYIYAALRQLLTYRGIPVSIDGKSDKADRDLLMVTVSNGRYLGGAFQIAPNASVVDGHLDVCVVKDANVLERIRLFAAAFRGAHERLRSVQTLRTNRLTLSFPAPPAMELDGELRQAASREVKIECVPRALSVIAAEGVRL
jgi:YegS/Rv2252/BmrU family lipid kinase